MKEQNLYYYCPDCGQSWQDAYEKEYGRCDSECPVCEKPYTPFESSADYYVQIAKDYLGSACRDNTRQQLIHMGKKIDTGKWEDS